MDQQWTWRENQALARRLHAAKLKGACVEDIDYRASRGLDKSVIRAMAQKSAWAEQHENIFVLGPTGVGKSFVACALAQKACRDGYSALYTRAVAMFRDLAIARADGSLRALLARLSRIDALGPVELMRAQAAVVGPMLHELIDPIGRKQPPIAALMPALSTAGPYLSISTLRWAMVWRRYSAGSARSS